MGHFLSFANVTNLENFVDWEDNVVSELYLETGHEGLLPVHTLHWLVTHRLLEVALGEELSVDQLGALLGVHPVLGLVSEVSRGHQETGDKAVMVRVTRTEAILHHGLHLGDDSEVVSEVCGEDVVPDEVQAPGVVSLAEVLQDVAALGVEDAHTLGEVVSLHHAALARVEAGQYTVTGDLVRVVGAPVVEVMAHGSYHQGKRLEAAQYPGLQQPRVLEDEVSEVSHSEAVTPIVVSGGPGI